MGRATKAEKRMDVYVRSLILEKLKRGTQGSHERVSLQIDILRPNLSPGEYSLILQKLWGFYAPIEEKIRQALAHPPADLDFERREKTMLIEQDLHRLNFVQPVQLPVCTDLPELSNLQQVLGCLYVLEGATLGGQIISRHVKEQFGFDQGRGCSYFCSYGKETSDMWKTFCRVLADHAADSYCEEQMLSTACTTFDAFNRWLSREQKR